MLRVLTFALALAVSTPLPVNAQQSTDGRPYVTIFKYSASAVKAIMENPQDREAAARKLSESLQGKMVAIYFTMSSPDMDGFTVQQYPDEASARAASMIARSSGSFDRLEVLPLMSGQEFMSVQQKAKSAVGGYAPPTTR